MTQQQTKIYDWLVSKPGYLKRSASAILTALPFKVTDVKHVHTALKEARLASKGSKVSIGSTTLTPKRSRRTTVEIIKDSNKAFKSMSKADKRVTIAKDVIAQLKAKKFVAKASHGYFNSAKVDKKIDNSNVNDHFELQDVIKDRGVTCKVCGIGSLFACEVLRNDNFKIQKDYSWQSDATSFIDDETIAKRLVGIFDRGQLDLIEAAFEKRIVNDKTNTLEDWNEDPTNLGDKALNFGKRYHKDNDRMIAIMENIIKNKGTFKP